MKKQGWRIQDAYEVWSTHKTRHCPDLPLLYCHYISYSDVRLLDVTLTLDDLLAIAGVPGREQVSLGT